jgi:protein-tyrosine phosphatase
LGACIYLTSEWEGKMKAPKALPAALDLPSFEIRGKVPTGLAPTVKFITEERAAYAAAKAEADKLPDAWRWPYVLIGWPDRGVINVEVAAQVVGYILRQLQAGKVVDTGCAGAHGRTGTLLAMLLIEAEGLTPEQAITSVRKRHCHKAIESAAQAQAIFGFAGKFANAEEVKRIGRC